MDSYDVHITVFESGYQDNNQFITDVTPVMDKKNLKLLEIVKYCFYSNIAEGDERVLTEGIKKQIEEAEKADNGVYFIRANFNEDPSKPGNDYLEVSGHFKGDLENVVVEGTMPRRVQLSEINTLFTPRESNPEKHYLNLIFGVGYK